MEILSPLTGKPNVSLEKTIKRQEIIEKYKLLNSPELDVARFFKETEEASLYRCLDTGYRFYFPSSLSGDDLFYQTMEKFPWYYTDWKWEHVIAGEYIKSKDKILEIGCAYGSFLAKMAEKGAVVEGLEMNTKAMEGALAKKIKVSSQSIEQFSTGKDDTFDVVCTFQVLEHVYDVKNFISSAVKVLRPGGKLIISVPNNDCFFLKNQDFVTNLPPHHMGLWNLDSLLKIKNLFNLTVEAVHLEPLQGAHVGFAKEIIKQEIEKKLRKKHMFLPAFIKKIIERFAYFGVKTMTENIVGHSILIVYQKNDR